MCKRIVFNRKFITFYVMILACKGFGVCWIFQFKVLMVLKILIDSNVKYKECMLAIGYQCIELVV